MKSSVRVQQHAVMLYEAQQRHQVSKPQRDRQRESLRLLLAECVEVGREERRATRESKP